MVDRGKLYVMILLAIKNTELDCSGWSDEAQRELADLITTIVMVQMELQ